MATVDWSKQELVAEGAFCRITSIDVNGRKVALKTAKSNCCDQATRDLLHEISVLELMVPHAHVAQMLSNGTVPGDMVSKATPFLMLPLLTKTVAADLPPEMDSSSVWARRSGVKRWPLQRACRLGAELACALDHCHCHAVPGSRVLHRDIKPANLGLDDDDHLVLFDFGLASLWKVSEGDLDGSERRCLTRRTGSLRTMAPEIIRGEPYNHKCDIYSWAVVLWHMASHDAPYCEFAHSEEAFVHRVAKEGFRPKLKSAWPEELCELLMAAWAPEADARPEMGAVATRLGEISRALEASALTSRGHKAKSTFKLPFGLTSRSTSRPATGSSASASPLSTPLSACDATNSSASPVPTQIMDGSVNDDDAFMPPCAAEGASPVPSPVLQRARLGEVPGVSECVFKKPVSARAVPAVAMSMLEAAARAEL